MHNIDYILPQGFYIELAIKLDATRFDFWIRSQTKLFQKAPHMLI